MNFTFKICQTVAGINNDQSNSQIFFWFNFWRVFVIWPNSVVSTLTSNSCWYMFFFVLGSLTPLSLILLANSATGNRESIPRQYSSNVSNTNLYWFCKELWHFLGILGYIVIIHWIYICCGTTNHRSYNTSVLLEPKNWPNWKNIHHYMAP